MIIAKNLNGNVDAEYYKENSITTVLTLTFDNIINIEQRSIFGHAYRIVKNHKMGFSSGSIDKNKNEIYKNAYKLAENGIPINVHFPENKKNVKQNVVDNKIKELTIDKLFILAHQILNNIVECKNTQITLEKKMIKKIIKNSNGINCEKNKQIVNVKFLSRIESNNETFTIFNSKRVNDLKDIKNIAYNYKCIYDHCRYKETLNHFCNKAIFSPEALAPLVYLVVQSLNGKRIMMGNSMFNKKIGRKTFSNLLTLYDNPNIGESMPADNVDDEGVCTKTKPLIYKGKIVNYYSDLITAAKFKLGVSSGNGFRRNGYTSMPTPNVIGIKMNSGSLEKKCLIESIKSGIYIDRIAVMGNMCTNKGVANVNIIRAYYIENGNIKGLVRNSVIRLDLFKFFNEFVNSKDCEVINGSMKLPYLMKDNIYI